MTDAIPNVAPMNPLNKLLFLKGILSAITMKHPLNIPDPPTPAMARPIISAMELSAEPQTIHPTRKTVIEDRNVHLVLSKV